MREMFYKKIIILVVVLVLCAIMQFSNIGFSKILESIVQDKKAITESDETITGPQIEYTVISVDGTQANILINITDEDNGIKQVEYPNGHIVYCNGEEKRKQLAIDYEVELGEEYIYKVTTEDGVETDKKIMILNNYTISISDITTTGFKINILGLTQNELSKIENIRYCVDTSLTGTNYQDNEIVTGLLPRTQRYVWTEIIYNGGDVKRSLNYQNVYTKHTHSDDLSCYIEYPIGTIYSLSRGKNIGHKTGYCKWSCSSCGIAQTSSGTPLWNVYHLRGGFVYINGYNTYTDIRCEKCGALDTLKLKGSPTSSAVAYDWGCSVCGKTYCALSTNADSFGRFKCYHSFAKNLVDTIPESGIAYSNNF